MSSHELSEWQAVERLTGPLGGHRGDIQMAILAAVIANSQRTKGRMLTPADFLPSWEGKRKLTPEELFAKAMAANTALGGRVRADN
ncbi:phage tail assembly protein T [Streptomyces californicus]